MKTQGNLFVNRKEVLYEMAEILNRLAKTETYPEDQGTKFIAKIIRKEGREPGTIQRWIDLPRPRTRGIL